MYVISSDGMRIYNITNFHRIIISNKNDASLVSVIMENESNPLTLGRYKNHKEAKEALNELLKALVDEWIYFTMPDSLLYHEEKIDTKARVKRRGSS